MAVSQTVDARKEADSKIRIPTEEKQLVESQTAELHRRMAVTGATSKLSKVTMATALKGTSAKAVLHNMKAIKIRRKKKGCARRGKGTPSSGHGRKDRGEAIIVKGNGKSYADVLEALRSDKKLTGLGDAVNCIRRAQKPE